jgi:hypothetical protein
MHHSHTSLSSDTPVYEAKIVTITDEIIHPSMLLFYRFALDLYKNQLLDVNLPFTNPFRGTTMVGYNHKNKVITLFSLIVSRYPEGYI